MFAPNVRGSSGFGKRFVNLDNGALRADGVRDIEATTRALIERGVADPRRLGIMGGSYGGYMVMAGVTQYPEMFAAGVDLFGVVNFATFFANSEPWMAAISTVEYGDPATQAEMLRELSPIHRLARPHPHPLAHPPRRQRHQRAGDRGRADRGEPQGAADPGRVHPVPGRGPWLAATAEPGPLDGGDRQLLQ